jgi:type I site-specific restriction endonuclease
VSTIGERILALDEPGAGWSAERQALAYQADRLADLLRREREATQAAINSNLDLIKRLKEANDKLEAVRKFVTNVPREMKTNTSHGTAYATGRNAVANETRAILEG